MTQAETLPPSRSRKRWRNRGARDGDETGAVEGELASPFTLVASAIAGRRVVVSFQDIDVAYSDGETIFLPGSDTELDMVGLIAQGALIAADSLDPTVVIRLVGQASAARRFVTLEMARALRDPTIPTPRRYRCDLDVWDGAIPESAADSLRLAIDGVGIPEAPRRFGTVRPRKVLSGSGGAGLVASLAKKPQTGRQKQVDIEELDDDDDSEESKILKLFSSPFSFENPIFKLFRDQLGMGRRPKPDGEDGGGAELPVAGATAVTHVGENAQLATAPSDLDMETGDPAAIGALYPEWDAHKNAYREDYCSVAEFLPADGEPDGEFDPATDYTLRRRLASLGLAYARHRHLADGDGLDINALVEFAVSSAMGETPDDHVYQARMKTAHDLGVVVLLDASGSTAHRSSGAPIWNQHRALAANLIGALEQVGDRVAAFGFNSRGRRNVRFLLVKDFEQRFNATSIRRLATLEPSGFTRIGAAIRHSTHIVTEHSGTANRLIIVVSDGFPYDDGYQGAYAEKDTKRALDEAVAAGVGCVCVSIASDVRRDALERLWGDVSHVQLGQASELSTHVVPMFQAALKAAGAPRDNRAGSALAS